MPVWMMAAVPKQAWAVLSAEVVTSLAEPDCCWWKGGSASHSLVVTVFSSPERIKRIVTCPWNLGVLWREEILPKCVGGQKLSTHFCIEEVFQKQLEKGKVWELDWEQSFFLSVCKWQRGDVACPGNSTKLVFLFLWKWIVFCPVERSAFVYKMLIYVLTHY